VHKTAAKGRRRFYSFIRRRFGAYNLLKSLRLNVA
jgi:hypothetical protein